jgi:hypothetical protein
MCVCQCLVVMVSVYIALQRFVLCSGILLTLWYVLCSPFVFLNAINLLFAEQTQALFPSHSWHFTICYGFTVLNLVIRFALCKQTMHQIESIDMPFRHPCKLPLKTLCINQTCMFIVNQSAYEIVLTWVVSSTEVVMWGVCLALATGLSAVRGPPKAILALLLRQHCH